MRVYVSGPYTQGDRVENTKVAVAAGDMLMAAGHAPFVPHLSHYWETIHTEWDYESWMRLDLAWVAVSEAVIRLSGYSPGADREVDLAYELGIPVFYSVSEFLAWTTS